MEYCTVLELVALSLSVSLWPKMGSCMLFHYFFYYYCCLNLGICGHIVGMKTIRIESNLALENTPKVLINITKKWKSELESTD